MDAWIKGRCGLPHMESASLLEWQLERVRHTVKTAVAHSPFYRTHLAGAEPERLTTPDAVARLPFTDGQMLANQGARMLCVPLAEVERFRSFPTSGTSGPPKRVWFTRADLERTVDFFSVGMQPLAQPGQTVAVLLGGERPGSIFDLLRQGIARIGVQAIYGPPGQEGAHCLVGTPAQALYLCRKGLCPPPQTVLLSADYISSAAVTALGKEWGCRVFTHYGLTETCYGLAVQCAAENAQHLRAADFYTEVVHPETGHPLPPGEVGEIVLTSLRSEALPLVRYKTGDIGSLQACACGSALPALGPVLGRKDVLAQPVNIHQLDDILLALPSLAGYTAVRRNGELVLTVEGALPEEGMLQAQLGLPVRVQAGAASPFGAPEKRKLNGE